MTALLLTLALLQPASAADPSYLVERVLSSRDGVVRLSVFRDGSVALVRADVAGRKSVAAGRVDDVERQVLGALLEACRVELPDTRPVGQAPGDASVELRLAPPGAEPRRLVFPVMAVLPLSLARLSGFLDAVQGRVASGHAAREDFSAWEPEPGERVELDDGTMADVVEVFGSGGGPVIRLRRPGQPTTFYLALKDLREKAVRRVAP